jgi:hypothetical protein
MRNLDEQISIELRLGATTQLHFLARNHAKQRGVENFVLLAEFVNGRLVAELGTVGPAARQEVQLVSQSSFLRLYVEPLSFNSV